jgi:protein-L-isoaspartate(D-aspartate) O-methyltransferase
MSGLDARAAVHQQGLVDELRRRGVEDQAILQAFAMIPRHQFIDRFWTSGPPTPASDPGGGRVVDEQAGDDVLEVVYAPDVALLTAPPQRATSSVSAPYLIAGMLMELDLGPGMRVLEIGAGSGYHAALLAALVGDPGLITTVDIDADLVSRTCARLARLGLGAITVLAGDGDDGILGGTFDRIVATVGCADISPAWCEQLDEDGVLLAPLVHGSAHPRVRLTKLDGRLGGAYVGYSGFVSMQGTQAEQSPWATCSPTIVEGTPARHRLPGHLAAALAPPESSRPEWNPEAWALGFYVALRDRRAATAAGLAEGESFARIERQRLLVGGADGDDLAQQLVALTEDWHDAANPGLDRYSTSFTFEPVGSPALLDAPLSRGPWAIRRLRSTQLIELN